MEHKLSCSPRREQIFAILQRAILNNEILDETPLNESKLAKEFGVSNTPVREAIRMLENEGLVESVPYRQIKYDPLLKKKKSKFIY